MSADATYDLPDPLTRDVFRGGWSRTSWWRSSATRPRSVSVQCWISTRPRWKKNWLSSRGLSTTRVVMARSFSCSTNHLVGLHLRPVSIEECLEIRLMQLLN